METPLAVDVRGSVPKSVQRSAESCNHRYLDKKEEQSKFSDENACFTYSSYFVNGTDFCIKFHAGKKQR